MKYIFSIIAMFVLLGVSNIVNAQHTTPRYGTSPSQDNTYGRLALGYVAVADVASATKDTVFIVPSQFTSNYVVTVSDSCIIAIKTISGSWAFDELNIIIQNTAGANHFAEFLGYSGLASKWGMASTGTKISLAASLSANLQFVFDGALYLEKSRTIR